LAARKEKIQYGPFDFEYFWYSASGLCIYNQTIRRKGTHTCRVLAHSGAALCGEQGEIDLAAIDRCTDINIMTADSTRPGGISSHRPSGCKRGRCRATRREATSIWPSGAGVRRRPPLQSIALNFSFALAVAGGTSIKLDQIRSLRPSLDTGSGGWNVRQAVPDQPSDNRREVIGSQSDWVIGFTPES
jgi:hypothetical protein